MINTTSVYISETDAIHCRNPGKDYNTLTLYALEKLSLIPWLTPRGNTKTQCFRAARTRSRMSLSSHPVV